MTASSRLPPLLLLASLLAGCVAPPPGAPPDPPQLAPGHLELTGCSGWDLQSTPLPAAAAPGEPLGGWEPSSPTATATVRMGAYSCGRLALGPFERPAKLLLDAHDRAAVPRTCRPPQHDPAELFVLRTLWTDDDAVARHLKAAFGLPAAATPIAVQAQGVAGAGALHTWTWGDPHASTLTVADAGDPWPLQSHLRLFWPRGDGVGMLDLHYTFHATPHAWRPAQGMLAPPMLLGEVAGGAFAGPAGWQPGFAVTGGVTLFKDRACQEPEDLR